MEPEEVRGLLTCFAESDASLWIREGPSHDPLEGTLDVFCFSAFLTNCPL